MYLFCEDEDVVSEICDFGCVILACFLGGLRLRVLKIKGLLNFEPRNQNIKILKNMTVVELFLNPSVVFLLLLIQAFHVQGVDAAGAGDVSVLGC